METLAGINPPSAWGTLTQNPFWKKRGPKKTSGGKAPQLQRSPKTPWERNPQSTTGNSTTPQKI